MVSSSSVLAASFLGAFLLVFNTMAIYFTFFFPSKFFLPQLYTRRDVRALDLISAHGKVMNLRKKSSKLYWVADRYKHQGTDISSLVPKITDPGIRPLISKCGWDNAIASSFINKYLADQKIEVLSNDPKRVKCTDPITKNMTHCFVNSTEIAELEKQEVGLVVYYVVPRNFVAIGNDLFNLSSFFNVASAQSNIFSDKVHQFLKNNSGKPPSKIIPLDQKTLLNCLSPFYAGRFKSYSFLNYIMHNWIYFWIFVIISFFYLIYVFSSWTNLLRFQKTETNSPVILLVNFQKETHEVISETLEGIQKSNLSSNSLLFVVCDSTNSSLHQSVLSVLKYSGPSGLPVRYSANNQSQKAVVYSGYSKIPFVLVAKIDEKRFSTSTKSSSSLVEMEEKNYKVQLDLFLIALNFLRSVHKPGEAPASTLFTIITASIRGLGLDPASYPYLLSIDGDVKIHPDAPKILISRLKKDKKIAAVNGTVGTKFPFTSFFNLFLRPSIFSQTYLQTGLVCYRIFCHESDDFGLSRISNADTIVSGKDTINEFSERGELCVANSAIISFMAKSHYSTIFEQNMFFMGQEAAVGPFLLSVFPEMTLKTSLRAKGQRNQSIFFSFLKSIREWVFKTSMLVFVVSSKKNILFRKKLQALFRFFFHFLEPYFLIVGFVAPVLYFFAHNSFILIYLISFLIFVTILSMIISRVHSIYIPIFFVPILGTFLILLNSKQNTKSKDLKFSNNIHLRAQATKGQTVEQLLNIPTSEFHEWIVNLAKKEKSNQPLWPKVMHEAVKLYGEKVYKLVDYITFVIATK